MTSSRRLIVTLGADSESPSRELLRAVGFGSQGATRRGPDHSPQLSEPRDPMEEGGHGRIMNTVLCHSLQQNIFSTSASKYVQCNCL